MYSNEQIPRPIMTHIHILTDAKTGTFSSSVCRCGSEMLEEKSKKENKFKSQILLRVHAHEKKKYGER